MEETIKGMKYLLHRRISLLALAWAIVASRFRFRNWTSASHCCCCCCVGSGGGCFCCCCCCDRFLQPFPNFLPEVVFSGWVVLALSIALASFHTFAVSRSRLRMIKQTFPGSEALHLSRLGDGPFDSFPRFNRVANSSANSRHPLLAAYLIWQDLEEKPKFDVALLFFQLTVDLRGKYFPLLATRHWLRCGPAQCFRYNHGRCISNFLLLLAKLSHYFWLRCLRYTNWYRLRWSFCLWFCSLATSGRQWLPLGSRGFVERRKCFCNGMRLLLDFMHMSHTQNLNLYKWGVWADIFMRAPSFAH